MNTDTHQAQPEAAEELAQVSDEEILKFLRGLPMVGGTDDGAVTMADLVYEIMLWPFVRQVWRDVKGSPGLSGKVRRLSRIYVDAELEMERVTGERRRSIRVIDVDALMAMYAAEVS